MKQRHNIPAGKSLLLRLSVCRLFLICCFAAFACSVFGQKIEQEGVLYKESGMLAVGSMSKGKFVEGSRIKFYYVPTKYPYRVKKSDGEIYLKYKDDKKRLSDLEIFADCIYYSENGEECFKGSLNLNNSVCYGTFMFCNSLDAKSFVHNSKDSSDKFFYDILSVDSAEAWVGDWLVSAKKTENGYFMRAKDEDDGYKVKDTTLVAVEGILPMGDFDINSPINTSLFSLLDKLECAKVTLKNRDEFDGTVKLKTGIERFSTPYGMNVFGKINCELLNGTYKYHSTGDVFVGDYQRIYYGQNGIIHVPTNGIMKLANGEQFRGDSWLTQYPNVKEFGRFFELGDGPSEIRRLAQEKQREFDKRKAEERAEELQRQWEIQQRQREMQARRQHLINKYGYKYGQLLADDKVCLGMTKEMVSQIRDESKYSITKYIDELGTLVEIWISKSWFKWDSYTFGNGILISYSE